MWVRRLAINTRIEQKQQGVGLAGEGIREADGGQSR